MQNFILLRFMRHSAFIALFFFAVTQSVSAEDLAYRLYKESGLQIQLQSIPGAFDQGLNQYGANIPQKQRNDIIEIGKESFHEPSMAKVITSHLGKKLNKDELKKLLDWHATDLAKKITQIENDTATPEGQQKLMAYMQSLSTTPPSESYVKQIQQLTMAVKAVDVATELAANMQFSMGAALALASAKGEQVNLQLISDEVEKSKPQLQQQLAQIIMVSMLYTYQNLTEQELKAYIDFVSGPLGSKFYDAVYAGLDEAFIRVGKEYGKALAKYFEQDAKQSNT